MLPIHFRSTKKEFWKSVSISLLSLAIIHLAVIVIHERINDATPMNRFSYILDKSMEHPEALWASLGGDLHLIEVHLAVANERMDEAEHFIKAQQSQSGSLSHSYSTTQIDSLFKDAYQSLLRVHTLLKRAVQSDTHNIDLFTIALRSQSTHTDILRRMNMIHSLYADEDNISMYTDTIAKTQDLLRKNTELVALFDIAEDIQQNISGSILTAPE